MHAHSGTHRKELLKNCLGKHRFPVMDDGMYILRKCVYIAVPLTRTWAVSLVQMLRISIGFEEQRPSPRGYLLFLYLAKYLKDDVLLTGCPPYRKVYTQRYIAVFSRKWLIEHLLFHINKNTRLENKISISCCIRITQRETIRFPTKGVGVC